MLSTASVTWSRRMLATAWGTLTDRCAVLMGTVLPHPAQIGNRRPTAPPTRLVGPGQSPVGSLSRDI